MTLEVINELSRWIAVEPEWSSLLDSILCLTPFQLPVWLYTWWSHFGNGRLRVFVLRRDGELRGVVPCFFHEWNDARQITLVGSGISDYLEPAVAVDARSEMVAELETYLAESSDWDVCNWQDLAGDSVLRNIKGCDRMSVEIRDDTPSLRLALAGSFDDFWHERPPHLRRNVRRYRDKAASNGTLEFNVSQTADAELLAGLIDLHTSRWAKQGQPGMVVANSSAPFLREIACLLARRDMLRLFALRYRGKVGAIIFGISYRNVLYGYLTAFDPAHEALGLGRTLLFESLQYAFSNGFVAWDFLRGTEPYKFWWGAGMVPKSRLIVTRL